MNIEHRLKLLSDKYCIYENTARETYNKALNKLYIQNSKYLKHNAIKLTERFLRFQLYMRKSHEVNEYY